MKFAADENLPQSFVKRLEELGYETRDLKTERLGDVSDLKVVELAGDAVILTFDKDFLKDNRLQITKVVIFDFPNIPSRSVLPYLDPLVKFLSGSGVGDRFVIVVSVHGIEVKN